MTQSLPVNPFYSARTRQTELTRSTPQRITYAKLLLAPVTASPVPHLTSSVPFRRGRSHTAIRSYPGNCGGNLIKDLLRFFRSKSVFDPMTGSGTCAQVCDELGIYCFSSDMHQGVDACNGSLFPRGCFDLCWIHPPYWRMKLYTSDSRDLSRAPTLDAFINRYRLLIENCAGAIAPGGKVAILMGDYSDREAGYIPAIRN